MAQKSLLTIDTDGTRETVTIDGKDYALTDFDSFSAIEQHKISRLGKAIQELMAADELDDAAAENVTAKVDELFNKIAGNIPDDVKEKLKPGARQRITSAYFLAFKGVDGALEATPSGDGSEKPYPGSSDSTGKTQETG